MKLTPLLVLTVLVLAGCGQPPRVNPKPDQKTADKDPTKTAIDIFRQSENVRAGEEWTRYRSGLDQLKTHFAKPELARAIRDHSAQSRSYLETEVHLSSDELAEVESTSFRTPDAHHLDEAFLFADAAKALEVPGHSAVQVAENHFRWVVRNVLLHAQGDVWHPPAFTLRRGHGSVLERSLVFLALLRQAGHDGCLVVAPDGSAEPTPFLVAALHADEKASHLYLFDPHHGTPLWSKDRKGILTLKEAVEQPDLLESAPITPVKDKPLEAWLVCPLYSMSPRMHELQKSLTARGEAVSLYLNPIDLSRDIVRAGAAKKIPIRVWNPPISEKLIPHSPTRALRHFLPSKEGGIDNSDRALRWAIARVPFAGARLKFSRLGLTRLNLPKPAFDTLQGLAEELVNKYDMQAREMYLHGDLEGALRRHERLQRFVHHEALTRLVGDPAVHKEVEEWRKAVIDSGVEDRSRAFLLHTLSQDQLLRSLIEVAREKDFDQRTEKLTVLSRVLAVGLREHLLVEMGRIQAAGRLEKAVHLQALVDAKKGSSDMPAGELRDAWRRAHSAWETVIQETPVLNSAIIEQRLKVFQQVPADTQLDLLETLHLELQKHFHDKLRLADCLQVQEGTQAANKVRAAVKSQIELLRKEGKLADEIRRLRGLAPRPATALRLTLLEQDWLDQGNYYWLIQQIDRQISTAKK